MTRNHLSGGEASGDQRGSNGTRAATVSHEFREGQKPPTPQELEEAKTDLEQFVRDDAILLDRQVPILKRSISTVLSENEKLRASLLEAVGAWRPIESAPKDGTAILGGYFNQPWADSHRNGDIVRCWFQPEFDAFISSCRQMVLAPGYTFCNGKTSELHSPAVEAVSHWMPLPPPPEHQAVGGE